MNLPSERTRKGLVAESFGQFFKDEAVRAYIPFRLKANASVHVADPNRAVVKPLVHAFAEYGCPMFGLKRFCLIHALWAGKLPGQFRKLGNLTIELAKCVA
jgi:hypothetical protein